MPTHIAEIVASLLIIAPEERAEVAIAMATQDHVKAGRFAGMLLDACYDQRQREALQRMVRSALTVPTVTDEEDADIDKQLKLA